MTTLVRSYTNLDDETVIVSKEHLDTAVEIKLELQNNSPSRRCNWKKHKELMQKAGFNDSENSESYRCLVKSYQKDIGKLVSNATHAELVCTSKTEALRAVVGEMYQEKRENQMVLLEINKHKREFARTLVLADEFRNALMDELDWSLPRFMATPIKNISDTEAIVILTDVHVGVVIDDVYGNSYSYEIAKKRLQLYITKIVEHCQRWGVTQVHLAILGDLIEHVYMRYKQKDDVEFGMAKQIVKATQLIIWFIASLAEFVNVTVESIAGNHDRMHGDKNMSFDDDNANVIINEGIKTWIETANSPRINMIESKATATEIHKEVNGKVIKLVHGHLDSGNKRDRLKGYISMSNEFVDCLVYGHLHNFRVEESDHGRLTVGVGCLVGRNSYSKTMSCATDASQAIIFVTGEGEIHPVRVGLQVN